VVENIGAHVVRDRKKVGNPCARTIKDKYCLRLLSNEKDILGRERENFLKSFEPSHSHNIEHRGTFGGKYHHCSRSLPSGQNTETGADLPLGWKDLSLPKFWE